MDAAPQGVVICEARAPDCPVIYANAAMTVLTGYPQTDLVGRPLRVPQGEGRDQGGVQQLRAALHDGSTCRVVLRDQRRDGSTFSNEITLVPLRDATGQVTHFVAFQRDMGAAEPRGDGRDPMSTQSMLAYLRDDKLSGLLRRPYFDELLRRDWSLAQRESRRVSLLLFDLDHFLPYRDVFGRQGADQSFRRIARVVGGCFRRASDLCARFDEDQIAAFSAGVALDQAVKHAETVLGRIRDLAIHHPRSGISRYVTASCGVVSCVPPHDMTVEKLYECALEALRGAKEQGRNQVLGREASNKS